MRRIAVGLASLVIAGGVFGVSVPSVSAAAPLFVRVIPRRGLIDGQEIVVRWGHLPAPTGTGPTTTVVRECAEEGPPACGNEVDFPYSADGQVGYVVHPGNLNGQSCATKLNNRDCFIEVYGIGGDGVSGSALAPIRFAKPAVHSVEDWCTSTGELNCTAVGADGSSYLIAI